MMRTEKMSSRARIGAVTLAAMAVVLLSGCGQKKDVAPADGSGSDVVAKVNGDELTAGQLTIALQKQRGMRPDAGDAASKQEALALLSRIPESAEVRHIAALARIDDPSAVVGEGVEAKLDDLLERVKGDEAARQEFLDLLEVIGPDDPRTARYRKALTARLF